MFSLTLTSLLLTMTPASPPTSDIPLLSGPPVVETAPEDGRRSRARRGTADSDQRRRPNSVTRPLAQMAEELDLNAEQESELREMFRAFRHDMRDFMRGALGETNDAPRARNADRRRDRQRRDDRDIRNDRPDEMAGSNTDRRGKRARRGGQGVDRRNRGPRAGHGRLDQLNDDQRAELEVMRSAFLADARSILEPDQLAAFDRIAPKLLQPQRSRRGRGAPNRERMLEQFDADGDGTLNEAERFAMEEMREQRRQRMLEQFDANDDGRLDADELEAAREQRRAMMLEQFDLDGDGRLGDEERREARRSRSQLID